MLADSRGGRASSARMYETHGDGAPLKYANRHLSRPFGLETTEACKLVRVALALAHHHPTSKCVAISLRMLKRNRWVDLLEKYRRAQEPDSKSRESIRALIQELAAT